MTQAEYEVRPGYTGEDGDDLYDSIDQEEQEADLLASDWFYYIEGVRMIASRKIKLPWTFQWYLFCILSVIIWILMLMKKIRLKKNTNFYK